MPLVMVSLISQSSMWNFFLRQKTRRAREINKICAEIAKKIKHKKIDEINNIKKNPWLVLIKSSWRANETTSEGC